MIDKAKRPMIKNIASAPMVYFDQCPTLGVMNNIVELDLAARVLNADAEGVVSSAMVCVAHLRCSIESVVSLRTAIDKALKMANYGDVVGEPDVIPSPGAALARRVKELNS